MKFLAIVGLVFLSTSAFAVQLARSGSGADSSSASTAPGAVTQVVTLLKGMLDKSRTDGTDERKLFAKFKCYCDDNEKEKTEAIATATKSIALLENDIDELLGSNGELSQQVAKLKALMDQNVQDRSDADALRTTENTAYIAEKGDLEGALSQLDTAIGALAAIGADQALASAAHDDYMAGFDPEKNKSSLVGLSSSIRQALLAASARMKPQKRVQVEVLLQQAKAPISGTYVAQSGEVFGILKQINATFASNLDEIVAAEAAAVEAHTKWSATKLEEFNTMKKDCDGKSSEMGTNDGDLGTKRTSLSDAVSTKDSSIEFLDKLTPMCKDKSEDYKKRQTWRANEEAIIAEAIAILNSDHSFNTFGKVTATSFVQVLSEQRREAIPGRAAAVAQAARPVRVYLQQLARKQHSSRLARIASMLVVGNPFEKVLDEIEKIEKVLEAEQTQDDETKSWCNDERTNTDGSISTKTSEVSGLDGDILQLKGDIDHPDTGLKTTIKTHEDDLEGYRKSMIEETENRREENKQYQKKVGECVEAAAVLDRAINLLEKHYEALKKEKEKYYESSTDLLQADPAPPATWTGEYEGQSSDVETNVISVLNTIKTNTVTEETNLHDSELTAQHDYEDMMQGIKDSESTAKTELATAKKSLAEKEEELEEKRQDKENTEREIVVLNRYLEEIKPGCDFITTNYATRKSNRQAESNALDTAVTKIKGTPAYTQMETKAKEDSWGKCKETCKADEPHADCQACLNKVSVPGWCAGNPTTPGCS